MIIQHGVPERQGQLLYTWPGHSTQTTVHNIFQLATITFRSSQVNFRIKAWPSSSSPRETALFLVTAARVTTVRKWCDCEILHRTTHKFWLVSAAEGIDLCSLFELARVWVVVGEDRETQLCHLWGARDCLFLQAGNVTNQGKDRQEVGKELFRVSISHTDGTAAQPGEINEDSWLMNASFLGFSWRIHFFFASDSLFSFLILRLY